MKLVRTIVTKSKEQLGYNGEESSLYAYEQVRHTLAIEENRYIAEQLMSAAARHIDIFTPENIEPMMIGRSVLIQPYEYHEIKYAGIRNSIYENKDMDIRDISKEFKIVYNLYGYAFAVIYYPYDVEVKKRIEMVEENNVITAKLYIDVKVKDASNIDVLYKKWC